MGVKQLFPYFAIFFAIVVAGCISQSGGTLYSDDAIILSDFNANPALVEKSQSTTVTGYVINKWPGTVSNVTVLLYDFCPDLFKVEEMKCGSTIERESSRCVVNAGRFILPGIGPALSPTRCISKEENVAGCYIGDMRPSESKDMWWKLRESGSELSYTGLGRTPCDMKALVSYNFKTKTLAPVTIVSQANYEQVSKGFTPQPVLFSGGPVKAELTINTPQPIAAGSSFDITVKLTKSGAIDRNGYIPDRKMYGDNFSLSMPSSFKIGECDFEAVSEDEKGTTLYRPKRDIDIPEYGDVLRDALRCTIIAPWENVLKSGGEVTMYLTASAQYYYEFRTSTKVVVDA